MTKKAKILAIVGGLVGGGAVITTGALAVSHAGIALN